MAGTPWCWPWPGWWIIATAAPAVGWPEDWLKALPDMISRWLPPYYVALGTDGFGRSDTREALRSLFEIDASHVAAATVAELARCAALPGPKAAAAIKELGIDPEKLDPFQL